MSVVEGGDQLALGAVPVMKYGRNDPARLDLLVETNPVVHFQGRGMIGARPRNLFEEIVLAQGFDQTDRYVLLRQRE